MILIKRYKDKYKWYDRTGLTVVPIGPAVVHPEFAVGSQNGESVVDDGTQFRVDILGLVFTGTRSVPGPVDEVTHDILVTICVKEQLIYLAIANRLE